MEFFQSFLKNLLPAAQLLLVAIAAGIVLLFLFQGVTWLFGISVVVGALAIFAIASATVGALLTVFGR